MSDREMQPFLPSSGGTRPTVLFVDDEERILRSLRMLFHKDYEVKTTTDGHEALAMVRGTKVHVLVSDQRMPIMPGVELLRLVKEASPNTMRLLLTGYSDLEAIVGSINEGEIFRYIAKPWSTEEIKGTVAKAAEIALSLEEVQELFARYDLLDEQVGFLKGWFKDTLPTAPIERLALLRLDGDLYESTMDALTALYDRLSPGGFVIVDDYYALAACQQAVDEFRAARGADEPLERIDRDSVFWRKAGKVVKKPRGGKKKAQASAG